jgi:hypothetical protein
MALRPLASLLRRRVALISLAVALLAGVGLAWLLLRPNPAPSSHTPKPVPTLDQSAGRAHASEACTQARTFTEAARANSSSEVVFRSLDRAITTARSAVDADPHWVRLLSGLQLVRYSLEHDDPTAARDGIATARSMCAELHVELRP